MADLSKVELFNTIYNLKDSYARSEITIINSLPAVSITQQDITNWNNMLNIPLATESVDGLMSHEDKAIFNRINPNIQMTVENVDKVYVNNAKANEVEECVLSIVPGRGPIHLGSNLLDASDTYGNFYINASGKVTASSNDLLGPFIAVSPGQDIYYTGVVGPSSSSSINRRLHVYDATQTWIKQVSYQGGLRPGNSWSTHGTLPSNAAYVRVSWGNQDTNMMISVGAPSGYEPYEWIQELLPHTSTTLYHNPDDVIAHGDTYTISYPQAAGDVFGCEIDVIAGKLYVTMAEIASYNGETLPGYWYSDRDEYAAGTTPSIGAQVVYVTGNRIEYSITPIALVAFLDDNYLWCNNGIVKLFVYNADTLVWRRITVTGDTIDLGNTQITESDVYNWNHPVVTAVDDELNNYSTNPVQNQALYTKFNTKANLASPTFTGVPKAPTATAGDSSTQIATTQFVDRDFTRKPVLIYDKTEKLLVAGTINSGKDGANGLINQSQGEGTSHAISSWNIEGMDLSEFRYIRVLFRRNNQSYAVTGEFNIPLDIDPVGTINIFVSGAAISAYGDRNRLNVINCAVDSTKSKFCVTQTFSLYGTMVTAVDELFVERIYGCY